MISSKTLLIQDLSASDVTTFSSKKKKNKIKMKENIGK